MINSCIICNSKNQRNFPNHFINFVTSDCNLTKLRPKHQICLDCGLVHKQISDDLIRGTTDLYNDYRIYDQGDNEEQRLFDANGKSKTRTAVLFENLSNHIQLKQNGNLAEIGCGYGKFLTLFNSHFPNWNLFGYDLGEQYNEKVSKIPNTKYFLKNFEEEDRKFDFIVGIHVLEHLQNPLAFLLHCRESLTKDGKIFIQIPNVNTSTFDLIIADHICHFSYDNILFLADKANLNVELISADVVSKELFCIFSKSTNNSMSFQQNRKESEFWETHLKTLKSFEEISINFDKPVKIFGSSIGASWISQYLRENLVSFIDEDPSRVGNRHLDIPIEPLNKVCNKDNVLLPFSTQTAKILIQRLSYLGANFIHPEI